MRKFKGAKLVLFLLLAGPLVGFLLAFGVTKVVFDAPVQQEDPAGQGKSIDLMGQTEEFVTEAPAQQSYGLLLCGIDHTRTLADVILYARFDLDDNRAWLLQIPRDLYVDPNSQTGKINGACRSFTTEDPTKRIAAILETQLGLPVDGAAAITLSGVRALVDAVGGVPMNVEHEINYLPGQVILAGDQTITGEQAEWLLRHRSGYRMGDLDRLQVQKQFLFAAMNQVRGLGRVETLSIAAKNMGHVKTTVPFSELAPLLERAVALTPDRVSIEQLPTYGEEYEGLSVLCVNRFRLADALNAGIRSDDPVNPWDLQLVYPPEESASSESMTPPLDGAVLDFSWDFPDDGEVIE